MQPPEKRQKAATRPPQGFTLVEMIAVIAIIAIMLGLLAPAISSMSNGAGRKGAVNILMNTMEQARVAALETGRNVYVVFHRQVFPEQDAILVLRDPDPDSSNTNYDQLTKWIKLPKGVLLHDVGTSNILSQDMPSTAIFEPKNSSVSLTPKQSEEEFNILAFNAYGGVSFPTTGLMLIVSEGVRGSGGTEKIISEKKDGAGGYEIITFRRYTGRASLEVTTL